MVSFCVIYLRHRGEAAGENANTFRQTNKQKILHRNHLSLAKGVGKGSLVRWTTCRQKLLYSMENTVIPLLANVQGPPQPRLPHLPACSKVLQLLYPPVKGVPEKTEQETSTACLVVMRPSSVETSLEMM